MFGWSLDQIYIHLVPGPNICLVDLLAKYIFTWFLDQIYVWWAEIFNSLLSPVPRELFLMSFQTT